MTVERSSDDGSKKSKRKPRRPTLSAEEMIQNCREAQKRDQNAGLGQNSPQKTVR